MPIRNVYESDFSQQLILDEAQVAQVVVHEHPDLPDELPRRLYANAEELEKMGTLAIKDVVVVTVSRRDKPDEEPEQLIFTVANFNKLATGRKMGEILTEAAAVVSAPLKPERRQRGDSPDYESLDHAGEPHRGKTSDIEAALVRENLEAVNARLAAAGHRLIDPEDPKMRERYGFDGSRDASPVEAQLTLVTDKES